MCIYIHIYIQICTQVYIFTNIWVRGWIEFIFIQSFIYLFIQIDIIFISYVLLGTHKMIPQSEVFRSRLGSKVSL
jgi:hypothetical protein